MKCFIFRTNIVLFSVKGEHSNTAYARLWIEWQTQQPLLYRSNSLTNNRETETSIVKVCVSLCPAEGLLHAGRKVEEGVLVFISHYGGSSVEHEKGFPSDFSASPWTRVDTRQ